MSTSTVSRDVALPLTHDVLAGIVETQETFVTKLAFYRKNTLGDNTRVGMLTSRSNPSGASFDMSFMHRGGEEFSITAGMGRAGPSASPPRLFAAAYTTMTDAAVPTSHTFRLTRLVGDTPVGLCTTLATNGAMKHLPSEVPLACLDTARTGTAAEEEAVLSQLRCAIDPSHTGLTAPRSTLGHHPIIALLAGACVSAKLASDVSLEQSDRAAGTQP